MEDKKKTKEWIISYIYCVIDRECLATSQLSHHCYWGINRTGSPTCLCHRFVPPTSGAMNSLPSDPHRRCGKLFLSPGDDFVQKWGRYLGELTREFRNCEASFLKNCLAHTFLQFWRHQGQSAITVFVVHIGAAFSELLSPSSGILESRSWRETISAEIFPSAVQ